MQVYLNLSIHLKDAPKDQLGLRSERWQIGKDDPLSLCTLCLTTIKNITDFYLYTMPDESNEIESQLEKLALLISRMKIKAEQINNKD